MIKINPILPEETELQSFNENKLVKLVYDFKKDGYLFLESIFTKEFIHELNIYFIEKYKKYFEGINDYYSSALSDGRYNITIDIKDVFNTSYLYANPLIISLIKQLLTDKSIIGDIACVTSLPGAQAQGVHRDGVIFDGLPISRLLPPHTIGLLIPLIPFNSQNGATRIWPGSHINNSIAGDFENDPNFFDANMDIGSCILIDSRIVHKGNANNSNQIRPLLYINYSAQWYFDQNIYKKQTPIKMDDENFERVPEMYKPLFIRRNIYK